MNWTIAEALHDWHDFYLLIGTASATLVGLMFVVASIGTGVFTDQNRQGLRLFTTPTVLHFSAVLFICLMAMIPSQTWATLGALLGIGGIIGFAHSAFVLVRLRTGGKYTVDLSDRFWYALVPFVGYLLIVGAAWSLLKHSMQSPNLIAGGLILLLAAGIRNAWDMTLWVVIRPRGDSLTE